MPDTDKSSNLNYKLISKYFGEFKSQESIIYKEFEAYFLNFYNYCFEQSLDNMLKEVINFKN